ncbi:hypothetical protein BGZ49_004330 [Haplosporangium sp. Z 27]|nr:hypothetical protein BGZ49_004330 [Haplosporangium sp. Z 27]
MDLSGKAHRWTWNSQIKEVRGRPPFEAIFGQTPCIPLDNQYDPVAYGMDEMETLNQLRIHRVFILRKNMQKRIIQEQKQLSQDKLKPPQEFKVGDLVLAHHTALEKQWSGKFSPQWHGPYTVHSKRSGGSYILVKEKGSQLEKVGQGRPFNHSRLKLYRMQRPTIAPPPFYNMK